MHEIRKALMDARGSGVGAKILQINPNKAQIRPKICALYLQGK